MRQQTSAPKMIGAPTRPGPKPGVFGGTWARNGSASIPIDDVDWPKQAQVLEHAIHHQQR